MAQKISPITTRIPHFRSSDSSWYDSLDTEKAVKLDIQFRKFLTLLGNLLSKSKNSAILRIAVSSYRENTHLECFIASKDFISSNTLTLNESILTPSFKQGSFSDLLSLFNRIKYFNSSISQKLCAFHFLERFQKEGNQFNLPYQGRNYTISAIQVDSEFQSASFLSFFLGLSLTKGKAVKVCFSEISKNYTENRKAYAYVKGFRIQCKGRISNQEEASTETLEIGRIARGKFSDRVDYKSSSVRTSQGLIGVKVWINYYIENYEKQI